MQHASELKQYNGIGRNLGFWPQQQPSAFIGSSTIDSNFSASFRLDHATNTSLVTDDKATGMKQ